MSVVHLPPIPAWKLINDAGGFVAVVVAPTEDAARNRLRAQVLRDEPALYDVISPLITAAAAVRLDPSKPGTLCWALV